MAKAYVLLSGGVDSTTCLALAAKQYGRDVSGVSVYYGQRHTKEIIQAGKICSYYDLKHQVLNLQSIIGTGGLTDENQEIPDKRYDELPHGISPTYVPFRNGLMIAALASRFAAVDPEAEAIYIGTHAEDGDNWAYPDCTPEFIGGMANAIYIGTYQRIRLVTPLLFMRKWEIVRRGSDDDLRVPWDLTWSCYRGEEIHCGACPTCYARIQAFIDAGVVDPTEYASPQRNVT